MSTGQWVIKLYDMMSQLQRSISEHLSLGIHQKRISRMMHAMTEQKVRYSCRVLVSLAPARARARAQDVAKKLSCAVFWRSNTGSGGKIKKKQAVQGTIRI